MIKDYFKVKDNSQKNCYGCYQFIVRTNRKNALQRIIDLIEYYCIPAFARNFHTECVSSNASQTQMNRANANKRWLIIA